MSATVIQDKIVALLKADATIAAEFGVMVNKGMAANFNFQKDSKGIYVYLMMENFNYKTVTHTSMQVAYPFVLPILFFENDDSVAEDRKTSYSTMIRKVLDADVTLGGLAISLRVGDPRYEFHPKAKGQNYITIPVTVLVKESVA